MKNCLIILAAVVAVALFGTFNTAHAQVSVSPVLDKLSQVVEKVEKDNAQVLFIQVDNLSKGQQSAQTYTLESNSKYGIAVVGDENRIQDVDVRVLDANGDKVAEDKDNSNIAVVSLTPKRTQQFKIVVSAYKMSAKDGFFGIVIFRID